MCADGTPNSPFSAQEDCASSRNLPRKMANHCGSTDHGHGIDILRIADLSLADELFADSGVPDTAINVMATDTSGGSRISKRGVLVYNGRACAPQNLNHAHFRC